MDIFGRGHQVLDLTLSWKYVHVLTTTGQLYRAGVSPIFPAVMEEGLVVLDLELHTLAARTSQRKVCPDPYSYSLSPLSSHILSYYHFSSISLCICVFSLSPAPHSLLCASFSLSLPRSLCRSACLPLPSALPSPSLYLSRVITILSLCLASGNRVVAESLGLSIRRSHGESPCSRSLSDGSGRAREATAHRLHRCFPPRRRSWDRRHSGGPRPHRSGLTD